MAARKRSRFPGPAVPDFSPRLEPLCRLEASFRAKPPSVSPERARRNKTGPGWNHFPLPAKASRNRPWLPRH